jgi:nucleotide-binding universal stress UspA family protein
MEIVIMTYRSLVVHLDDTPRSDRRSALAARVARTFAADLAGVYVVASGQISPFASAMMPSDMVSARLAEAAGAQADAEARFRSATAAAELVAVEWRAPAGDPIEAAVMHARYADLAIFGQPSPDDAEAGFASDLAHAVIVRSGRPVLLVPFTGDENASIGERVLIAWKDARESARAVADALPLLARAQSVVIVSVAPTADVDVQETIVESRLVSWLAHHGISARYRREVAPDIDAGNLLLSQAADLGADLIVMGAYSRARISELVLGGVTRLMLSSMTVPVLMAH